MFRTEGLIAARLVA